MILAVGGVVSKSGPFAIETKFPTHLMCVHMCVQVASNNNDKSTCRMNLAFVDGQVISSLMRGHLFEEEQPVGKDKTNQGHQRNLD